MGKKGKRFCHDNFHENTSFSYPEIDISSGHNPFSHYYFINTFAGYGFQFHHCLFQDYASRVKCWNFFQTTHLPCVSQFLVCFNDILFFGGEILGVNFARKRCFLWWCEWELCHFTVFSCSQFISLLLFSQNTQCFQKFWYYISVSHFRNDYSFSRSPVIQVDVFDQLWPTLLREA